MPTILYCGDTSLDSAAAYLAGLMTRAGWDFTYVPSDCPLTPAELTPALKLIVLSDYPADNLSEDLQQVVVERVKQGCGLLMIGGWESFHGLGGNWDGTPVGELLPVDISNSDDRFNGDSPQFLFSHQPHPIVDGFPWTERPPLIGGYNRFTVRRDGELLLSVKRFRALLDGESVSLSYVDTDPLLVLGQFGDGLTAAIATDVAPHWVGPFVDWGDERITAQAAGSYEIEVGNLYAGFWTGLLRFLQQ